MSDQLKTNQPYIDTTNYHQSKLNSELRSPEKKTGRWSQEEDDLLRKIVPFYGEKQWRKISQHMKGRTAIQCLHRWTKILKPGLVKGPWTAEEDQKLYDWVSKEGPTKWSQCSLVIIGRSGKQCRERWFNNLNPVVKKGNWSVEEDDLIFKLYMQYGSSWSKIAKSLRGRTENSIKNRFYSTIRKIAADRKKLQIKEENLDGEGIFKEDEQINNKKNDNEIPFIESNNDDKSVEIEQKSACMIKEISNPVLISQNYNSNPTNTLYKLLQEKGTELLDPHLKDTNEPVSKKEKINLKIETKQENKALSECDSDVQFEDLLSSIEKTLNKELMMKEMSYCKDMSLDELQQRVFQFCNNNILEFREDDPSIQQELSEINRKIQQEMFPFKFPSFDMQSLKSNQSKDKIETPIPIKTPSQPQPQPQPQLQPQFQSQSINQPQLQSQILQKPMISPPLSVPMHNFSFNHPLPVPAPMPIPNMTNPKAVLNALNTMNGASPLQSMNNMALAAFQMNNSFHPNTNNINGNLSDDQKMYYLIQQLHSLEGMLSNTREELMKLENTFGGNERFPTHTNEQNGMNLPKNDEIDYFFDNKNSGQLLNDLFMLENTILNNNNLKRGPNSIDLANELGQEILKKQKGNIFDFDLSNVNFLNNILDENNIQ